MSLNPARSAKRVGTASTGPLAGFAAYAVGYLATLAITTATETGTVVTRNVLQASGWLYYNSQFSKVTTSATGEMSVFGGEKKNLLTDGSLFTPVEIGLPTVVYHAVPIVVLTLVGFAFVRRSNIDNAVDTIAASGSLALGTTAAAAFGSWLFGVSAGNVTVSPQLLDGVLMTGLFFPLLFGSIGGLVGAKLSRS